MIITFSVPACARIFSFFQNGNEETCLSSEGKICFIGGLKQFPLNTLSKDVRIACKHLWIGDGDVIQARK